MPEQADALPTQQPISLISHSSPWSVIFAFLAVIPDPIFFHSGSRIRIKEFKYFNPKKWFLSSRKYDQGSSSRIRILTFYPSRIPDPGVKKASDPGSGSATLLSGSVSVLPLNPDANLQHWCLSCAFLRSYFDQINYKKVFIAILFKDLNINLFQIYQMTDSEKWGDLLFVR